MLERFYPDKYVKNAYDLPYEKLYEQGYRGIIYDIDNTLVPHNAPADERAKALFARLHGIGFSCCLLSNNKRKRVADFNEEIGAHMVWNAAKPAKQRADTARRWKRWERILRILFSLETSFSRMSGGRAAPESTAFW